MNDMNAKTIKLTEEQERAATILKGSRIALLTGGPGVGKTTTFSQVARTFDLTQTACCAPTGRAAQRMTEALQESGLGSVSACTIHTLLKPQRNGHDKRGWGFFYDQHNRLPVKVIIADEVSMIDNQMFNALLSAARDEAKIILIGDPDQLPPVGVGAGLRDCIDSETIPHARLTQVHRFAGRIAHVCKSINRGEKWMPSPKLDDSPDAGPFGPENMKHIEHRDPAAAVKDMSKVIDLLVTARGMDPRNDLQVLCSRNDQGPMSRKVLNQVLQQQLNAKGESLEGVPFRVSDKVMCLQNGMRESFDRDGGKLGQVYVANGEQGIIVSINKKEVMVKFGVSDTSLVKFPRATWENQLTLSYAITVHKAQGGGWKCCLYMVDEARHVDRSLIYTGISRAKQLCVTIGRKHMLDLQCQRVNLEARKTFLAEKVLTKVRKGLS